MVGLLALFVFLGTCLVIILIVATNSLSALRSYSTLQTHWTQTRKEATYQIVQYAQSKNPRYQQGFRSAMRSISNLTQVREELLKDDTDRKIVQQHLLESSMLPVEIGDMITTFRRLKNFTDFKTAIRQWEKSDSLVYLYNRILDNLQNAGLNRAGVINTRAAVRRIKTIDNQLTQAQYALAAALTNGTYFLRKGILWLAISLGGLLLVISSVLSVKFLDNIKVWSRRLGESEQRYRSLFDQNLNAVFSMDEHGTIQEGNAMFDRYFGKFERDDDLFTLSALIKDRSPHEVTELLNRVRHEQSFGFLCVLGADNEEPQYFYIILMPIFIDQKMKGIFGVAEDVTFQKRAEAQIRQQLREKSILLAEIHHRVKNNLAVISALLELQLDGMRNNQARCALEEAKGRIKSMAVIHDQIYHNENLSNIDFYAYILEVSEAVKQAHAVNHKNIVLHIEANNIALTLDQTIPCGLIIHELLANAYKYAFENRAQGNIWIQITEKQNKVYLIVADDGVGLTRDWQHRGSETIGLPLVEILVQQLEGVCLMGDEYATHFEISFEKKPLSNGFLHKGQKQ